MSSSQDTKDQPFWDHVDELRVRIMRCVWVFVVCSIVAYFFRHPILAFLKAPLFAVLPPDKQNLYFTGLFESFLNHLKVSGIAGFFLSLPFIFYQFWGFVAPGMYEKEKKLVIPFVSGATAFFVGGAAFAYYMVFPMAFKFMIEFGQPQDVALITVNEYFTVIFRLLFFFGLTFEFPVVLVLLATLGVVRSDQLAKQRNFIIIGITAVCAMFAPPDALSMIFMMIPLIAFFELSLIVIRFIEKKREPQATEAVASATKATPEPAPESPETPENDK